MREKVAFFCDDQRSLHCYNEKIADITRHWNLHNDLRKNFNFSASFFVMTEVDNGSGKIHIDSSFDFRCLKISEQMITVQLFFFECPGNSLS